MYKIITVNAVEMKELIKVISIKCIKTHALNRH